MNLTIILLTVSRSRGAVHVLWTLSWKKALDKNFMEDISFT